MEIDPYLINPKKKISLDGKYKLSWTEDSLYTTNNVDDSITTSGTSHLGSSFYDNKKIFWFLVFIVSVFSIILGRGFFLQILMGDEYRAQAEGNRQRIIPIISERGLVFDRNNIQLTQNIPNFSLTVIPKDLPKEENELNNVIDKLISITNQDKAEIKEVIDKYKDYRQDSIIIAEDIPYETALKTQIARADLPGINVQLGSKRLYIKNSSSTPMLALEETTSTIDFLHPEDNESVKTSYNTISHVLGYVGKLSPDELDTYYRQGYLPSDSIGKTGIEKMYESYLRGTYGEKRIEVNAQGREQQVLAEKDPIAGSNLILSIDINIQNKLEDIFIQKLKEFDKQRASGIVMNPRTGEILALVSYPGFDNNDFSGGISSEKYNGYLTNENKPLFNRAISGSFPSGSVIKPAFASAALQEGIITSNTSFLSNGGLRVDKWFFPDWQSGGHGMTNVRRSLAWSVNTFYYYIGGGYGDFSGLGVDKMNEYLKKFGFGKPLGIDLPAESGGFIPTPQWKQRVKDEPWYIGDTYNYSIGQGDFLATPLQIANMTASIANGGTLYKPHVVKDIINPETGEKTEVVSEILDENFISPSNVETVRLGMKDCVDYGSCRRLSTLPFAAAAKTGTAQWSQEKDNHAWFTSFAPYDNPEIVITVLMEEGGEGSTIGSQTVDAFYRWWAEYRNK
ncbi:MAG: penicillin-binding protein 2 [Candidatus Magasanikbacteria bacterium CG_4_10_14_0_2_um_filter_33_14]|uniref:Penicillin-binding protein 2 n=1 Tax=Candidatus Magasanikbacteria bacterium CG_4_10_14_0_2_um_filter_33_14 TaxID=1974636 RepID=A0A2M7VAJ4_9BACT|nr:MAG: penicillin-binding protein 2 [Candidatus Magasanikbacteria bacterium CG_4_10_14_0_2_um_filter_33_14]